MPQAPIKDRFKCGFWWKLSDDVVRTKRGRTVRETFKRDYDHAYLVYFNDNRNPLELIARFSDKRNGKVEDPPHDHQRMYPHCWFNLHGFLPLNRCFLHRKKYKEICKSNQISYEDMKKTHNAAEICKDQHKTLERVREAIESKLREAGPTPRPRGTA
jgi:hypothetical protein